MSPRQHTILFIKDQIQQEQDYINYGWVEDKKGKRLAQQRIKQYEKLILELKVGKY